MNRFHKSLLIGAAVISLGSGAIAAPGDAAPAAQKGPDHTSAGGHYKKWDPAKMKERMEKRQADLRDKLQLTANQEGAWQAYTSSMTPPAKGARPDRAEWEKLSAPERMEKQLQKMKEHQARLETRLSATKTFYAALTPEQQKVFNDNTHRGHGRYHRGKMAS